MRAAAISSNKATVSSKGQIVIPRSLRNIDQFFGRCKRPNAAAMSIDDIDSAIEQAVLENDVKLLEGKAQ